jgi:glycosyltransferase involved in cell wall biosynthesis
MRIVCVHQGYELYGSDRCFVESVAAMRDAWPAAEIEVVLPCQGRDGLIVAPLRKLATRIVFEPILVLRRHDLWRFLATGLFRLAPALWRAVRRFRSADLVYVNTVVVLDYLIASRLFPDKALIHIHEISEGFAQKVFRALLRFTRGEVVFNSKATRAAYALSARRTQHVVYNGIESPVSVGLASYDGSRALRLLMIGRISRIKGQDLVIEALTSLPRPVARQIELRIVGGAFDDDAREAALRAMVAAGDLGQTVHIEPFQDDPSALYQWADVVMVPSRRPESLGRVAIEAMAHGRPALVAAQGGLVEVVEDGVTGWIVPPNRGDLLARKLAEIVAEPAGWARFPAAARARYEAVFSHRAIVAQFQAIVRARLADSGGAQTAVPAHERGPRTPAGLGRTP